MVGLVWGGRTSGVWRGKVPLAAPDVLAQLIIVDFVSHDGRV